MNTKDKSGFQTMTLPDGWMQVKSSFYNELLQDRAELLEALSLIANLVYMCGDDCGEHIAIAEAAIDKANGGSKSSGDGTDKEISNSASSVRVRDSAPKHTPAPWHWYGRYGLEADSETVLCGDCGTASCGRTRLFVSQADADLIAAAPEMLAALKAVMRFCKTFPGEVEVAVKKARGL